MPARTSNTGKTVYSRLAGHNRNIAQQVVQTPRDFMREVCKRWGHMSFDLAATKENRQADRYFDIEQNTLRQDWSLLKGNLWLNPEYANINPYARKCSKSAPPGQSERRIFFLVPASTGSNWFGYHVHQKAMVRFLSPRLQFVGHKDPFTIDLMLAVFGEEPGYSWWRWR